MGTLKKMQPESLVCVAHDLDLHPPWQLFLLRVIVHSHLIKSSGADADDWTVLFLTESRTVLGALGEDVEGHYHCDKNVNTQCARNENGLIFSFDCVGLLP